MRQNRKIPFVSKKRQHHKLWLCLCLKKDRQDHKNAVVSNDKHLYIIYIDNVLSSIMSIPV
nr:MAG TPA: hypothetical protein [Caudoviricetes sp.]